jgi:hypothetical protein
VPEKDPEKTPLAGQQRALQGAQFLRIFQNRMKFVPGSNRHPFSVK